MLRGVQAVGESTLRCHHLVLTLCLLSLRMGRVKNTQDVKVLLLQENSLSLQVIADQLFLFLYWLRFSVNLLKYDFDKVHLAISESIHLLDGFEEFLFVGWSLQPLNDSFGILKLLLLQLPLHLLRVVELERVWHEFKALIGFIYNGNMVDGWLVLTQA